MRGVIGTVGEHLAARENTSTIFDAHPLGGVRDYEALLGNVNAPAVSDPNPDERA
jgi:hypothetical protein